MITKEYTVEFGAHAQIHIQLHKPQVLFTPIVAVITSIYDDDISQEELGVINDLMHQSLLQVRTSNNEKIFSAALSVHANDDGHALTGRYALNRALDNDDLVDGVEALYEHIIAKRSEYFSGIPQELLTKALEGTGMDLETDKRNFLRYLHEHVFVEDFFTKKTFMKEGAGVKQALRYYLEPIHTVSGAMDGFIDALAHALLPKKEIEVKSLHHSPRMSAMPE